jgi:hypothetical protein
VKTTDGNPLEIILPFAITSDRDEMDWKNLRPYLPGAESVREACEQGMKEEFEVWIYDTSQLVIRQLQVWPFLVR